jgi:hypothetical protein
VWRVCQRPGLGKDTPEGPDAVPESDAADMADRDPERFTLGKRPRRAMTSP